MKTSNPYGASDTFKTPPETVNGGLGTGKAKARYPSGTASNKPGGGGGTAGGMKKRAYTPGGPTGS